MPLDLATFESGLLHGAGRLAGALRTPAWFLTKLGARAGFELGYGGAKVAAATAVGVAQAGVMTARAAGNVALHSGRWAGRVIGGPGGMFHKSPVSLFGRTFHLPHELNRRSVNAITFGALGLAGAAGAASALTGPRWNVNHSIATGQLEVERPDFLGATGSLTLATAAHRRRRPGLPAAGGAGGMNYGRMLLPMADDLLIAALHSGMR